MKRSRMVLFVLAVSCDQPHWLYVSEYAMVWLLRIVDIMVIMVVVVVLGWKN